MSWFTLIAADPGGSKPGEPSVHRSGELTPVLRPWPPVLNGSTSAPDEFA